MNANFPAGPADQVFGIQQVASVLGVSQRTLRFYEDKGLIAPARIGATRVYSRREIGRMQVILRGKKLGFSLREIQHFLDLYDADRSKRKQMAALAASVADHLAALERQREAIDLTRAELLDIQRQIAEWMAEK